MFFNNNNNKNKTKQKKVGPLRKKVRRPMLLMPASSGVNDLEALFPRVVCTT
jgi:hypothetical protein